MRVPYLPICLSLILTIAIPACSSFDVNTDYNLATEFSKYSSYYLKADLKIPGDVLQSMEFDRTRIYDAIEHELKKKGFKSDREADADLFVVAYAGVKEKVNLDTYGYRSDVYWTSNNDGSNHAQKGEMLYTEGTLHIDVLDAKEKALIWKGQGRALANNAYSTQEREQNIIEAVEAILNNFPPRH